MLSPRSHQGTAFARHQKKRVLRAHFARGLKNATLATSLYPCCSCGVSLQEEQGNRQKILSPRSHQETAFARHQKKRVLRAHFARGLKNATLANPHIPAVAAAFSFEYESLSQISPICGLLTPSSGNF